MKARAEAPWRPTAAQLLAARGNTVPDVIRPGLRVLFCGINPGLYSGAVRHHFARPGNRFWKLVHAAGFTAWQLSPFEERQLLEAKIGVTNLVARTTAAADELSIDELRLGAARLRRKVCRYRPAFVAVLGIGAYRVAFGKPRARLGRQPVEICGSVLWLLPNPSGLNAHYQLAEFTAAFAELRASALPEAKGSASLERRGAEFDLPLSRRD